MNRIRAEKIALSAFEWMADDETRISSFLGVSGANIEDLRKGAESADFLGFVLDFILSEDQYVLDFVAEHAVSPLEVSQARQCLPGGGVPEWT